VTYAASTVYAQILIERPALVKKNQAVRITESVLCVVPIDEITDFSYTWQSVDSTLAIKPIWIGWSRDAGQTFITDDDLVRRHGEMNLSAVLTMYPEVVQPERTS
jgi:hypothetical protein